MHRLQNRVPSLLKRINSVHAHDPRDPQDDGLQGLVVTSPNQVIGDIIPAGRKEPRSSCQLSNSIGGSEERPNDDQVPSRASVIDNAASDSRIGYSWNTNYTPETVLIFENDSSSSNRTESNKENNSPSQQTNRLVAAIEDGRRIQFEPNEETGNCEIFAGHHSHRSEASDDDLAPRPMIDALDSGCRISSGYHPLRPRSPYGIFASPFRPDCSSGEPSVTSEAGEVETWHEQPDKVDTASKSQTQGKIKEARGHYLARRSQVGVEIHTVIPIQFDFYKQRDLETPSIYSNGTELDCSSPLFSKTCQAILSNACQEFRLHSIDEPVAIEVASGKERTETNIQEWLNETLTPVTEKAASTDKAIDNDFEVWEDVEQESSSKGKSDKAATLNTLNDVTNLRRSGYLRFNSFAESSRVSETKPHLDSNRLESLRPARKLTRLNDPKPALTALIPVTTRILERPGASAFYLARETLDVHVVGDSPASLEQTTAQSRDKYPVCVTRSDGALTNLGEREQNSLSPSDGVTSVLGPTVESKLCQDVIRAMHFGFALARLEGRVSPQPPSPIQRYVRQNEIYSDDAEVENDEIPLRQPVPLRWIDRKGLLIHFETLVGNGFYCVKNSSVNFGTSPEDTWTQRPTNPTPDRAVRSGNE